MNKKIKTSKNLEFGDVLYRYIPAFHIFTYEIFGIRKIEERIQYEVKCLSCTHGYQCECLLSINENNEIIFVDMIADVDCTQKYWHNGSQIFHLLEKEAKLEMYKERLTNHEVELIRTQEYLEKIKKDISLLKNEITNLNEKDNQV